MNKNNYFKQIVKNVLPFLFLFVFYLGRAQTCSGPFVFSSQAEVNQFIIDNPTCTHIIGDVYIIGDDVNNVEAFRNIEQIDGRLYISGTVLTGVWGFRNLRSIIDIELWNVPLYDLYGFINLQVVHNNFYLMGFSFLNNLTGLYNLHNIHGQFIISGTPLYSFDGNRLVTVGTITIWGNYNLINLNGWDYLTNANVINIGGNNNLHNLSGFTALLKIEGSLNVNYNGNLLTTDGMNYVKEINHLDISYNANLNRVEGFNNLRQLNQLGILHNPALTMINGFPLVNNITYMALYNNAVLNNLSAFDRILFIQAATIQNNINLAICHVMSICELINRNLGGITIINNAPGCLNVPEVGSQCTGAMKVNHIADLWNDEEMKARSNQGESDPRTPLVTVYPNPSNGLFNLNLSDEFSSTILVYNEQGKIIHEADHQIGVVTLNLTTIPNGIFILHVQNEKNKSVHKLIKIQ